MAAVLKQEGDDMVDKVLDSAETFLMQKDYDKAFTHYLLALKLDPDKRAGAKENFSLTFREWSEQLERTHRTSDLFQCYQQACELFPDCEALLNTMGTQLFRLGFIDEAACCFRRALKINPDFLGARQNLENVCSHLVTRCQFRMLNDVKRNRMYQDAIQKAVRSGFDSVLDIGTGTGLLSMIAAEAGAASIYGCEMSKTMYEMSHDVIAANQMLERIQLFHKVSTDLSIPADIPNRVSLIVTESFDAGLLGDHILSTLHHAWKSLLQNPANGKCRVIPCGAALLVCGVQCPVIRRQSRVLYSGLPYLDLHRTDIVCKTAMSRDHGNLEYQPYTTERLSSIRGGYQLLTDVTAFMHFNFNVPEAIEQYMKGFQKELCLQVTEQGRLDAIAMWFDLHLDEDRWLSSAPEQDSCWEQAIYPVLPTQLRDGDSTVRHGDVLQVVCDCSNETLTFRCADITRTAHNPPQWLPLHAKFELDFENTDSNLSPSSQPNKYSLRNSDDRASNGRMFMLEQPDIVRLNDLDYNRTVCSALEFIRTSYLKSNKEFSVLDISQGVSVLALQALKLGAREACIYQNDASNYELLHHIASMNNIHSDKLSFKYGNLEDINYVWNVLVVDLVETCGCLRQQVLEDIALARATCLRRFGSLVIPDHVTVYGLLIESESLRSDSLVLNDSRTLGFLVAGFINDFQMATHVDIELTKCDYKKLSDPFEMLTFDFNADDSDVPSYLNQSRCLPVSGTDFGQVTAVLYWFDLVLAGNIRLSTLDRSMHWRQAAVVQKTLLKISPKTSLIVKAACKNSCIDVTVFLP